MDIVMHFNEMGVERFAELVEWLRASPFDIHNLDIEGVVKKGDVRVIIKAPKVTKLAQVKKP